MTQSGPFSDPLSNPEEATRLLYKNWREKFVMPLLLVALAVGVIVLIPALSSADESNLIKAIFITSYAITGIVTVVKFSYTIRIGAFLLSLYALGLGELLRYGILGDGVFFFLGVIVLATLLLSPRIGVISIVVSMLTIVLTGWLMLSDILIPIAPFTSSANVMDWITGSLMTVMIGVIVILGFRRLEEAFVETQKQIDININTIKEERNNLEKKVVERTQQLRRVNEIGRTITTILDPDELLTRAVHLIGDEFECYYTAIFLMDVSGQWAELKVASGEAGKVLLQNKHRVDVSGKGTVATAIRTRQVCIVSDAETSHPENPAQPFTRFSWHGISISTQFARTDNPILPYTRSQLALPLTIGERVVGALEMHSQKDNAFSQQDADTYQNMANQVAIALENSRLFTEAQQSIQEMSATQQQYLQGAWVSLAAEQKFEYEFGNKDLPNMQDIEIPLTLRDQVIGQINMSNQEEWTPEQKKLIESVASQAALALENARLVEESQSVAMRERLVNEITSKIWASATIDSILQTTVRELGRALEAGEVNIEVSVGGDHE
ncbi:MAG: GAF domain-containing protein [Chloroflexi bacterium]|nr:GAF domain-containing protein [Chloroflexota bacterium]